MLSSTRALRTLPALAGLAAGFAVLAALLQLLGRWAALDEGDRETWSVS